jgi:cysteine-S-conjugate beta-lyase
MDFDEIVDRKGSGSLKWDAVKNEAGKMDVLPLWVADMDFPVPECVRSALRARLEHPFFGYERMPAEYFSTLSSWYSSRYGVETTPENFVLTPGVMPSIAAALSAFTEKGEGVLILTPVYHCFREIIEDNARVAVGARLASDGAGRWGMDGDVMGEAIRTAAASGHPVRALLFSNPHNPVGHSWSARELGFLLSFVEKHSLALICDEIHGDFSFGPAGFTSVTALADGRQPRVVVVSAPNKTFNLAGLHIGHAVTRNVETRKAMAQAISAWGYGMPNVLSITAAAAAYREGGPWLDALLPYIADNRRYMEKRVGEIFSGAACSPLEATYLSWIDCSRAIEKAGFANDAAFVDYLEETGRVKVSTGSSFGPGGEGFIRVNAACPRALLAEGLDRAQKALELQMVAARK